MSEGCSVGGLSGEVEVALEISLLTVDLRVPQDEAVPLEQLVASSKDVLKRIAGIRSGGLSVVSVIGSPFGLAG
jgi:hypothetical protein